MKKLIMIAAAAMLALNVAAEAKKEAPKKGGRGNILKELGLSKEQAAKMREINAEFGAEINAEFGPNFEGDCGTEFGIEFHAEIG